MRLRSAGRWSVPVAGAAAATVVLAGTALAGPPAPSNSTVARANEIMSLGYEEFTRTPQEPPFVWSTDGCSSPVPADPYRIVFDKPCRQHDFGYRNYGADYGVALSVTRETKDWIDSRFLEEMRRHCEDSYSDGTSSAFRRCQGAASAYYYAVQRGGDEAFF